MSDTSDLVDQLLNNLDPRGDESEEDWAVRLLSATYIMNTHFASQPPADQDGRERLAKWLTRRSTR